MSANGTIVPSHTFEHLTCFLPAVLALGAVTLPDVPRRHMWAASALGHTCWILYADSESGLAPDEVVMRSTANTTGVSYTGSPWAEHLERWEKGGMIGEPPGVRPAPPVKDHKAWDYRPSRTDYLLRPETVESFYYLWRTTGDEVWREHGWEVFEALQRESRVETGGYAVVNNVYMTGGPKHDDMPR